MLENNLLMILLKVSAFFAWMGIISIAFLAVVKDFREIKVVREVAKRNLKSLAGSIFSTLFIIYLAV